MLFERIVCAVAGHKYVVQRVFSATSRQVGCTRCGREWGMNDSVRSFIPWDGELEQFYRDIGQWPGQTPNCDVDAFLRRGYSAISSMTKCGPRFNSFTRWR